VLFAEVLKVLSVLRERESVKNRVVVAWMRTSMKNGKKMLKIKR